MTAFPRTPEPELMDDPEEARAYARADFSGENEAFIERLLERAGTEVSIAAVDLGTGPGDIPLELVRRRTSWRITAVDLSGSMIELAHEAGRREGLEGVIGWAEVDATATPFKSDFFDLVFSNSLLHHMADPHRLWAEVKRITLPGGYVFMRDLARPESEAAARRIVEAYAREEPDLLRQAFYRSLRAAFTPQEVRRQLDRAGLTGLKVAMSTDRHLDLFGSVEKRRSQAQPRACHPGDGPPRAERRCA